MALNKIGSPGKITKIEKINDSKASFAFDPNIIVKEIEKSVKTKQMTVDEVHEAVKSMGVVNYESEDLKAVFELLQSIGFEITQ